LAWLSETRSSCYIKRVPVRYYSEFLKNYKIRLSISGARLASLMGLSAPLKQAAVTSILPENLPCALVAEES